MFKWFSTTSTQVMLDTFIVTAEGGRASAYQLLTLNAPAKSKRTASCILVRNTECKHTVYVYEQLYVHKKNSTPFL